MTSIRAWGALSFAVLAATGSLVPAAEEDEAALTAEVYAVAKSAGNEAVMKHLSDPSQYEAMVKARGADPTPRRENLHVDEVQVEHLDATHAVARPRYHEKHTGVVGQEEFHLELKNGKWQVTNPPAAAK